MQISVGCEYAIHGILYLALQPQSEAVLVTDIAKAQNLPVSYLAKVFQLLAKAGLVKSFRGARGGYLLVRDPSRITLRDVIQAIEGATPLYTSLSARRKCAADEDCLIREAFCRAEASLYRELEKVTLYEIMESANRHRSRMKWLQAPDAPVTST